ncbi:MAG: methionyl-tRNA formyltransferase [Chloroflexi bacterium]|nr:methionyl-tRNA formyltransferase [Chloroflexota bacterium]
MSTYPTRLLFVGAVEVGRRNLEYILELGGNVVGIVTLNKERSAQTSGFVPFDDLAERHGIPLHKTDNINNPATVEAIRALAPDVVLVLGWQQIVGKTVLEIPPKGCIGAHASLLPRYRGHAPVNWALINGETEHGVTWFYLDPGTDSGDIIAQRAFPVTLEDTVRTVYEKVAEASRPIIAELLPALERDTVPRRPQPRPLPKPMPRRRPEDGLVDWGKTAEQLHNWVRALTHPYPGAFTHAEGRRVFIWAADRWPEPVSDEFHAVPPGTVLATVPERGVLVRTGDGALLVKNASVDEKADIPAQELVRRGVLRTGTRFT